MVGSKENSHSKEVENARSRDFVSGLILLATLAAAIVYLYLSVEDFCKFFGKLF